MSRGPVSEQAIAWALPLAAQRGSVYFFRQGRECPCDFLIANTSGTVFVRVKRTRCIHQSGPELEVECRGHLLRLRAVPVSPAVSRELWVCSRYGRWRFFRVTETGIEEKPGTVPSTPAGRIPA